MTKGRDRGGPLQKEWEFDWDNPKESVRQILWEELFAIMLSRVDLFIKKPKKEKK